MTTQIPKMNKKPKTQKAPEKSGAFCVRLDGKTTPYCKKTDHLAPYKVSPHLHN